MDFNFEKKEIYLKTFVSMGRCTLIMLSKLNKTFGNILVATFIAKTIVHRGTSIPIYYPSKQQQPYLYYYVYNIINVHH